MQKLYITLFLLCLTIAKAQNPILSSDSEISVLTIAPGTSLNDAFGHNGFRVKTRFTDIVYDYGRYPFNDPNFYLNFVRGKLLYSQGFNNYTDVVSYYKRQNRTIKEQVLNLSLKEKQELYSYLRHNSLPENKDYLYDFFYDNCATKIRDVSETALNKSISFTKPKNYKPASFRKLIQQNLDWNTWGSLGIDIALGSVIDQKATPYQQMFLPEYIFQYFKKATYSSTHKPLVKETQIVFKQKEIAKKAHYIFSPIVIFSLISLIILGITYSDKKKNKRSVWLDVLLFGLTGLIGIVILLLWLATDHTATAQNYNLLWAFPLNLIFAVMVSKRNLSIKAIKYLKFLVMALSLLTLHWVIGVQHFAFGLIPLLIALITRYLYLIKNH